MHVCVNVQRIRGLPELGAGRAPGSPARPACPPPERLSEPGAGAGPPRTWGEGRAGGGQRAGRAPSPGSRGGTLGEPRTRRTGAASATTRPVPSLRGAGSGAVSEDACMEQAGAPWVPSVPRVPSRTLSSVLNSVYKRGRGSLRAERHVKRAGRPPCPAIPSGPGGRALPPPAVAEQLKGTLRSPAWLLRAQTWPGHQSPVPGSSSRGRTRSPRFPTANLTGLLTRV